MNNRFVEAVEGRCWCHHPHPAWTGEHRADTSDPEWPGHRATCMCGGGAWGIPHHIGAGAA